MVRHYAELACRVQSHPHACTHLARCEVNHAVLMHASGQYALAKGSIHMHGWSHQGVPDTLRVRADVHAYGFGTCMQVADEEGGSGS